jgi:hypothetical protein
MKLGYVAVVSMLVVATSAPAHADCASTVNTLIDRMMDRQMKEALKDEKMTPEMQKMADDMVKEMKPKMKSAMTKACSDDTWSSEALQCLDDATDESSLERCELELTARQKASLERAMTKAMGMDNDDSTKAACGDAAKAVADLVSGLRTSPASSSKAQLERRREAAASLAAELAGLCVSDRWPEETIACMKSASSLTDLVTCRKKLAGAADEHVRGAELDALGSAGDCVKTTARAVDRITDISDSTRAHMRWGLAESCSADWWTSSALSCIARAKTTEAQERCEAKLTKSQRADVTVVMTYAMGIGEVVSDASLPKECEDYGAVIERLATCDKMPAQSRDALRNAYREASAGWKNLPPDVKANLATACKAGRDAVFESGKSLCGW